MFGRHVGDSDFSLSHARVMLNSSSFTARTAGFFFFCDAITQIELFRLYGISLGWWVVSPLLSINVYAS